MPRCHLRHTRSNPEGCATGVMPLYAFMIAKKVYDSVEHSILLFALHEVARCKRKCLVLPCIYINLHAVVKFCSSYLSDFPIFRGVQQGSVLSPTFLLIMDKLLCEKKECPSSTYIWGVQLMPTTM